MPKPDTTSDSAPCSANQEGIAALTSAFGSDKFKDEIETLGMIEGSDY
jgi:hypothetical protein